jgi:hypothetical protein
LGAIELSSETDDHGDRSDRKANDEAPEQSEHQGSERSVPHRPLQLDRRIGAVRDVALISAHDQTSTHWTPLEVVNRPAI